ncbi:MAG: Fic family protein [Deltaproteobacteria bacterium]|nr:Fic family protein [Deltaproteobacteria bacterium]
MYQPAFKTTIRVTCLLEDIAKIREQIRSSLIRVPWVPTLVKDAMARAAWGSTAIEGCTLSLEAVRGLIEGKEAIGYPDKHVQMAGNYLNALTWIQKKEKTAQITENHIFQLHNILGKGAVDEGPVGKYRKVDVRAGLHVGSPWKNVPKHTRDFLKWFNTSAKELPAVFSSAILHLRLAEIHPFRDGNGRVARIMATWEFYRRGFDTMHIFALDEVLQENRALYIKNLQRVQVEGQDLGGWIEFMAETILETLERVESRIRAFGPLIKEPLFLTVRQEKLLRILRERGKMGIRDIAQTLSVTIPGAHYVLKPLLRAGIIEKLGTHKNTHYVLVSLK